MALKLGLELFSLHCVQQELDKDPKAVLKKVLDIGFRHLEPANHSAVEEPGTGLGIPAEELKELLELTGRGWAASTSAGWTMKPFLPL